MRRHNAPQIPIEPVPNFIKLPAGMYLGESMGVATNSKGHIFVFNRNGESSRLYEFDQNGAFVHEIGRNSYAFAMAHAVRVDAQDNIWTVDEGTRVAARQHGVIGAAQQPPSGGSSSPLTRLQHFSAFLKGSQGSLRT